MKSNSELASISDYLNIALANHSAASGFLPTDSSNVLQKLSDGLLLCYLMNTLSKKGPVIDESTLKLQRPTIFHKLDHSNKAIQGAKKIGLQIVNIRAENIVEMKESSVIGLMSQIMKQCPKQKPQKKIDKPKQEQRPKQQIPAQQYEQPKQQQPAREVEPAYNIGQQEAPYVEDEQTKINKIRATPINPYQQPINGSAETGYHFDHAIGLQVLVLVGSLRQASVNKGIVGAIREIKSQQFFQNMYFHIPDLELLPIFNTDLQDDTKGPKLKIIQDLRAICRKCNGILVATPEYNGSISPVVKNAFDWLSRTYDDDFTPLQKKKVGAVSSSYLTEQQLNDIKIMGEHLKMNVMENNYYISLKKGSSNMETGKLQNLQEKERLSMWYQDFSHFVMSGKDHPQPRPRFLFN